MARKAKLRLSPYSIPLVKGWAGFVADVVIHPDRLSVGPNFVEVMEKDRSKTERELAEYRAPYIVKNKFIVPIYDFEAWLRPVPKPRFVEGGLVPRQKPSKPA